MGIEILRRVGEAAKGLPGKHDLPTLECGLDERPLLFNIRTRLGKGIIVEVKFIVTELCVEEILPEISGDYGAQSARTKCLAALRILCECSVENLIMNTRQHLVPSFEFAG